MKHVYTNIRIIRWAAVLGLTSLFAGVVAITPASADDWHGDRNSIRRDSNDIHRDQDRLHDLQRRREYLEHRHDWRGVHDLDQQITDLRWHIDHDRREVHQDIHQDRRARDRQYNNGSYQNGSYRNNSDRNGSYQNGSSNNGSDRNDSDHSNAPDHYRNTDNVDSRQRDRH